MSPYFMFVYAGEKMSIGSSIVERYFSWVYTPVYDLTTARLNRYRELQKSLLNRFRLSGTDKILCVGLGTGNEIAGLYEINQDVSITGIDISAKALALARDRAKSLSKDVTLLKMNAEQLNFPNDSFDAVFCFHVMDFVPDVPKASAEIVRVLRKGGQFIITFPATKEDGSYGKKLIRDSFRHEMATSRHRTLTAIGFFFRTALLTVVYSPLVFRPGNKAYTPEEIQLFFTRLNVNKIAIEEDKIYRDLAVIGEK